MIDLSERIGTARKAQRVYFQRPNESEHLWKSSVLHYKLKGLFQDNQCKMTETFFPNAWQCFKQERICQNNTKKFIFPVGCYQRYIRTVKIIQLCCSCSGLCIRMVYSVWFWSNLAAWREHTSCRKLQWQAEHVPISVSVCLNVEHFTEPMCFVDEDPDFQLIQLIVTFMMGIAEHCKSLAQNKWGGVIQNLERQLQHWTEKIKTEESHAPESWLAN